MRTCDQLNIVQRDESDDDEDVHKGTESLLSILYNGKSNRRDPDFDPRSAHIRREEDRRTCSEKTVEQISDDQAVLSVESVCSSKA